jgi:asparagine synthase (glutamine-hydrolysing)
MCGISGYFGSIKDQPSNRDIEKTQAIMKNRGTSASNFKKINVDSKKVINFLHTRISIFDPLPRSNQPFLDEDGMLIFNGSIYNYIELRNELLKKKIKFNTTSDTEVLLKFLNNYGVSKLDLLDGTWSFAYYNFKKKKLYLSRDRFGEKPLFYLKDKSNFIFGSYYDYILNLYNRKKYKINFKKIEQFIINSWKSSNIDQNYSSYFDNIYHVKPGTIITINSKGKMKESKFWNPFKTQVNKNIQYNFAKKILKKEIIDVVKKRCRADVPVASLLSGGVDSNIITTVASKFLNIRLDCFSTQPKDKKYSEKKLINQTIKKYKLKSYFLRVKKNNQVNLNIIKNLIFQTGFMFPTTTWLAYYYLNELIKKKGIKVLLTGIGGDELFSGYYVHILHYLKSIYKKKIFNTKFNEWKKYIVPLIRSKSLKDFDYYLKNSNKSEATFVDRFFIYKYFKKKPTKPKKNKIYFKNYHKNELYKDIAYYSVQGQLPSSDIISAFHGIDNRAPILSKQLYELAFSFPGEFLFKNGYTKAILRDAMSEALPPEIKNNKEKTGFFMGVDEFFDLQKKSMTKILFKNKKINSLLKINDIKEMLKKNNKDNQENHLIFAIINAVFFLEKYKKYI